MPRKADNPNQILMPILADLLPRGDGTFVLRPRITASDMDTWISPKEAARLIGVGRQAIYDLLDESEPLLAHKRPLKRKILVSLKSVEEYNRLAADLSFWSVPSRRKTRIAAVRNAIACLSTDPLQSA